MSSGTVTVVTSASARVRAGVPRFLYEDAIETETTANQAFAEAQEAVAATDLKRRRVDSGYIVQGELLGVVVENTRWDKATKKRVPAPEKHRPDFRPIRVFDPKGEPVHLHTDVEGNRYADLKVDIVLGTGTDDFSEEQSGSSGAPDVRDHYYKGPEHSKTFESNVYYALYEINGQVEKLLAARDLLKDKYEDAMANPPAVLCGHSDWADDMVIPFDFKCYNLATVQDVVYLFRPPKNAEKAKRPAGIPLEDSPADFWASVKKRLSSHLAHVPDPAEKERQATLLTQDVLRIASAIVAHVAGAERRRKAYMYDVETGKAPKLAIRPTIPKDKWDRPLVPGLWDMHISPMHSISFYACPRPDVKYIPGLPDNIRSDPSKWTRTIVYYKLMEDFMTPMDPVEKSRLSEFDTLHRALYMGDHTKVLPDVKGREETPVNLRIVPSLMDELAFALYKKYRGILEAEQQQVSLEPLGESDLMAIPESVRGLTEHLLRFLATFECREKLNEMVFSMFPATRALYDELCKREVILEKDKKDSPKVSYLHLDWAAHGVRLSHGPLFDDFSIPDHVIVNLNIQHSVANITMWDDQIRKLFGMHPEDVAAFPVMYGILAQMDAIASSAKLPPLAQCEEMLATIKDDKKKQFWRRSKDVYMNMDNKVDAFTDTVRAKKELEERKGLFEALLDLHVEHPFFPKEMAFQQRMVLLDKTQFARMRTKIFNFVFSHAQEYSTLHIKDATIRCELDRALFEIYARNREFAREEFAIFEQAVATHGEPLRPAQKPQDPMVLPIPAAVAMRALFTGRLAKVGCMKPKELEASANGAGVASNTGNKKKDPLVPAKTQLNHLSMSNASRKCVLMNSLLELATATAKKAAGESPFEQAVQAELTGILKNLLEAPNGKAWRVYAVNPFKADVSGEIVDYLLTLDTQDMGLLLHTEIEKIRQKASYNATAKNEIMRIMREEYHVGNPAMLGALSLIDVWNPEALIYLAPPMPLAAEPEPDGQRRHLSYQEVHKQREEAVLAYEALMKDSGVARSASKSAGALGHGASATQKVLANVHKFIKMAAAAAPGTQMPSITNPRPATNEVPATEPLPATEPGTSDAMEVDEPAEVAELDRVAHDPEFQQALLGKKMLASLGREERVKADGKKRSAEDEDEDDETIPAAKRVKVTDGHDGEAGDVAEGDDVEMAEAELEQEQEDGAEVEEEEEIME